MAVYIDHNYIGHSYLCHDSVSRPSLHGPVDRPSLAQTRPAAPDALARASDARPPAFFFKKQTGPDRHAARLGGAGDGEGRVLDGRRHGRHHVLPGPGDRRRLFFFFSWGVVTGKRPREGSQMARKVLPRGGLAVMAPKVVLGLDQ